MKKAFKYIIIILLTLIVGAGGTIFTLHYFGYLDSNPSEKNMTNISLTESDTIKSAIDKIYDSVVYVENYEKDTLYSSGSGFVYKIDNDYGYILTNYHVIDDADTIKVTNIDGTTVTATLLGGDEYTDIAVLRIDSDAALLAATLSDTDDSNLGDTVFTVGTPVDEAYMGTVTKGIISGKDRTVTVELSSGAEYVMEVLQVDAALNPGNSGGPLVNVNGEVIGITSMKLVEDEIEGMGFAIPIDLINSVLDNLENGETIERPLFGVSMLDVDSTYALYRNGITIDDDIDEGVVIVEVATDSPADIAGLESRDVILAIDDTEITNSAYFRATLYKYSVGDTITVKYYRDGKIKTTDVELNVALEDS